MRDIWTVFRKEIYRVFSDKRLILSIFILPGLSIFLIYSLMGTFLGDMEEDLESHESVIYESNMPSALRSEINSEYSVEFHDATDVNREILEDNVLEGEYDLVILFEENFESKIANYETEEAPDLEIIFNEGEQNSTRAYNQVSAILNNYQQSIIQNRLDNPEDYLVYNLNAVQLVDEQNVLAEGIASLMPMLIIIFLFTGAMSIGPDAIAGEKERGTIATLLVRPIRRRSIALGKVASLSLLALLSALSSFVGIILSLPKLMQMDDNMPDVSIYTFQDYFAILLVLLTTVIFVVGLVSIISAYAKTIKEASMLIMPVYFLAIIVGMMNSFGADVNHEMWVHLIPIYGQINILAGVLTFDYTIANLLVTMASSLIYTLGFVILLNAMFNSEKIMFSR